MIRNYNIVYKNFINNSKSNINIDIKDISSIVNHSANLIFCSCLNYLEKDEALANLKIIFDIYHMQIDEGDIIRSINFSDIKLHAKDFIENTISGQDFLSIVNDIKYVITSEDIYTAIDLTSFRIIQQSNENNIVNITLQRIQI